MRCGGRIQSGLGKAVQSDSWRTYRFSSYQTPDELNELIPKTGNWDLYYLSSGLSYHNVRHTFTFGFSYALSPTKETEPIVIVSPGADNSSMAKIFAQTFGVVLGYTYYFEK